MDRRVKRIWICAGAISGLLTSNALGAAENGPAAHSVKAAVSSICDWTTGLYAGAHFGYGAGLSNWSATQAGGSAPSLMGTLDFYRPFDAFKGTGSCSIGLQAGYNYQAGS